MKLSFSLVLIMIGLNLCSQVYSACIQNAIETSTVTPVSITEAVCKIDENTDISANEHIFITEDENAKTVQDCCKSCYSENGCIYFVFNSNQCFISYVSLSSSTITATGSYFGQPTRNK